MHCWPISLEACHGTSRPGDTRRTVMPSSVGNRQAAALYLREAGRSIDGREREALRQRAAQLILPR